MWYAPILKNNELSTVSEEFLSVLKYISLVNDYNTGYIDCQNKQIKPYLESLQPTNIKELSGDNIITLKTLTSKNFASFVKKAQSLTSYLSIRIHLKTKEVIVFNLDQNHNPLLIFYPKNHIYLKRNVMYILKIEYNFLKKLIRFFH